MTTWFRIAGAMFILCAVGCGGHLKYTINDALLADVPVAEKHAMLGVQAEQAQLKQAQLQARSEQAVSERDLSAAVDEGRMAQLRSAQVQADVHLAKSTTDVNRIDQAKARLAVGHPVPRISLMCKVCASTAQTQNLRADSLHRPVFTTFLSFAEAEFISSRIGRRMNCILYALSGAKFAYRSRLRVLDVSEPGAPGEAATTVWFALRIGPSTFGIFDAFPDDDGRKAHLAGPIAAALMAKAGELLAEPPRIEPLDVLAVKLPGSQSSPT